MNIITCLVLTSLITTIHSVPQITVYPSVNTINQLATYVFTLNIADSSILPGTAKLTFDSNVYSFTNSSGITGCYDSTDNNNLYSCSASSSSTISFSWNLAMSTQIYLNISSIKNPSYVSNFDVTLSFTPNGAGTFTPVTGTINSLQPDILTSCTMTYSPSQATSYSAVIFNIVNKNPIPAGGSLQLTFNGYTPASNSSNLAISTATSSGFVNTTALTSTVGAFYAFSNFFKAAVPASTSISFTLSYFLNPPTTSANYSITILTYASTSYQNKIDQKTCSITGIIDYPTSSLSIYTSSTLKVGTIKATLVVDFKSPTLINFVTDTISIQVATSSTSYILVYCLSSPVSTNVTGSALTCSNSSNGIVFPGNASPTNISNNTAVSVNSGIFFNSVVNSGAKTITVQFFRSGSSYSSNTGTITVLPNTLASASVTPANTLVLTSSTYSFVMQTTNPLGVGAVVFITLPTNITIASGTCTVSAALSATSSLSSSITCTATGQIIKVSNLSTTVLPGLTTITLNVSDITNPPIAKTTASIFYQTFYALNQTSNAVDDSSGFSLTMTPTPTTIPNGYFNVSRVDTTNLKYTSYTFTYKVYTSFPANGIINILLSPHMQLSSGATATYVLSTTGTNQSIVVTGTTNSSYTTLSFALSTGTVPANSIFTITVTNILNYYSYKPTNVQVVTFSNEGFGVQQSNLAAVTLTNTAPDNALVASDTNSNTINGNNITYTFSIKTTSILNPTDLISIELQLTNNANTQLLYTQSPTCKINSLSVSCSKDITNTKLLYVTVGSSFAANTVLSLAVSSVTLSRSMDQPGTITVNTLQVNGGNNYLISNQTFQPKTNTQANLINNAKLAINDNGISATRLNQNTSFTLSFQPTNLLTTGDYIVVSIPSSDWNNIATMAGSLCTNSNVFCSNYNSDSYKIRIDDKTGTAFPAVSNITVTFGSNVYVSTKNWADTYSLLTFNTYTKTNASIDSSTNSTSNSAAFTLACPNTSTFHCKTCDSSGFCQSCYQQGDGQDKSWNFGGYSLRQATGECSTSCGQTYYNSSNFCTLCTAPCYSCTNGSTSSCTSCIAPTVKVNSSCNANCPIGYFNSSGVCNQCSSLCSTCINTSTTCQTCNNNSYLYGTGCLSNCNGLTGYYPDNSTWVCQKCIANCSDCSGSASNCTSCASDYFLQSLGVCTLNCPSGTVKVSSILCTCNYTACSKCALTINTCTSCHDGLVLLNSACKTQCGSGYYVNDSVCISCTPNCSSCNSTGCSVCSSSATFLYNSLCYSTCPPGSTSNSNTCISCPSGCSTCSNSTVCTSCQSIYYLVVNANLSTNCVSSCSDPIPYVQLGKCVSACTPPLVLNNTFCISVSNNTNNTDSNSTNTTLTGSSSKIIPMPVTIAFFILGSVTVVSKITFQATIVWGSLSAFGGLCEIVVWLIFIIVAISDSTATSLSKIGMIVVITAYVINLILNILALCFFKKYVWSDDKFDTHKRKLKRTKCGLCMTYFFIGISMLFSHKWLDLLFSNFFETAHCIYKVSIVNKLTPLNYIRYASIFASIIAIAGAAIAGYDTQAYKSSSIIFMQSLDLILVTVVSCIFSIVVTKRVPEEYQNTTGLKRNDMQEEFEQDPVQDDINHFQKEEKLGNSRNKYKYSSSIRNNDPKENPLSKRNANYKNPIGEENNLTNAPLDNHQDDINRISLNDMTGGMSTGIYRNKKRIGDGLDLEEIEFVEESGDSLLPSRSNNLKKKFKNRYGSEGEGQRKQADQKELKQKQKLKDNIQSKLNQQQRQETKVIASVDVINTALLSERHGENSEINLNQMSKKERKKEKLEVIEASGEENLSKLSDKEREKASEIKNAMSLLKAKKISIDDYLQYLDIIEEEDEEKNSDDYQNKRLASKIKGRQNQSSHKKPNNLVKSLRKNDRRQRSARYQKDSKIFVQHENDVELGRGRMGSFDEQKEPQQPDFHQTPIRGRNQSQQFDQSDLQELRFSAIRSPKNRSEKKSKKKQGMNDLISNSLESGDNDDPTLADQFIKGNTLRQVQKDQLPPSNLYSTQKMPGKSELQIKIPKNPTPTKMGPNRLITDQDQIQYIEFQGAEGLDGQTSKGQLMDFDNNISPSQFNEPNQRIENDQPSNAPIKPRIPKPSKQGFSGQLLQVEDIEGEYDEFQNQQYDQAQIQRYQSDRHLDYDEIMLQKKRNQKQKQLEKIYLPRIDATKGTKKKKIPKPINTGRSDQK